MEGESSPGYGTRSRLKLQQDTSSSNSKQGIPDVLKSSLMKNDAVSSNSQTHNPEDCSVEMKPSTHNKVQFQCSVTTSKSSTISTSLSDIGDNGSVHTPTEALEKGSQSLLKNTQNTDLNTRHTNSGLTCDTLCSDVQTLTNHVTEAKDLRESSISRISTKLLAKQLSGKTDTLSLDHKLISKSKLKVKPKQVTIVRMPKNGKKVINYEAEPLQDGRPSRKRKINPRYADSQSGISGTVSYKNKEITKEDAAKKNKPSFVNTGGDIEGNCVSVDVKSQCQTANNCESKSGEILIKDEESATSVDDGELNALDEKQRRHYGRMNSVKVIQREDSQDPIFKGVSAIVKVDNFAGFDTHLTELRNLTGVSAVLSEATGDVCLHGSWQSINKAYTCLQAKLPSGLRKNREKWGTKNCTTDAVDDERGQVVVGQSSIFLKANEVPISSRNHCKNGINLSVTSECMGDTPPEVLSQLKKLFAADNDILTTLSSTEKVNVSVPMVMAEGKVNLLHCEISVASSCHKDDVLDRNNYCGSAVQKAVAAVPKRTFVTKKRLEESVSKTNISAPWEDTTGCDDTKVKQTGEEKSIRIELDSGNKVELIVSDCNMTGNGGLLIDSDSLSINNEQQETSGCNNQIDNEETSTGIVEDDKSVQVPDRVQVEHQLYHEQPEHSYKIVDTLENFLIKRNSSTTTKTLASDKASTKILNNNKSQFGEMSSEYDDLKTPADFDANKKESLRDTPVCPICSKTFTEKRYLAVHMKRHAGEKKHECPICKWKFFERSKMTLHMETHKPPEERNLPYKCSICEKGFYNLASWKDHLNTHLKTKPHQCDQCFASFAHRVGLHRHQKIHTEAAPFGCKVCGKSFRFKSNLDSHFRLHTGEGKYKCDLCSKTFTVASSLRRHNCKVNMKQSETLYMCSVCTQVFRTMHSAEHHICVAMEPVVPVGSVVSIGSEQQTADIQLQSATEFDSVKSLHSVVSGDLSLIDNTVSAVSTVVVNSNSYTSQQTSTVQVPQSEIGQCSSAVVSEQCSSAVVLEQDQIQEDQHPGYQVTHTEDLTSSDHHGNSTENEGSTLYPGVSKEQQSDEADTIMIDISEVNFQGDSGMSVTLDNRERETTLSNPQCDGDLNRDPPTTEIMVTNSAGLDNGVTQVKEMSGSQPCGVSSTDTSASANFVITQADSGAVVYVDEMQLAANTLAHLSSIGQNE